jgi:hypothetical protein
MPSRPGTAFEQRQKIKHDDNDVRRAAYCEHCRSAVAEPKNAMKQEDQMILSTNPDPETVST